MIYPSMLHWTFGVLYAAIAFCLPRLSSLLYFLVLFLFVRECVVVGGVVCVGGPVRVGDYLLAVNDVSRCVSTLSLFRAEIYYSSVNYFSS